MSRCKRMVFLALAAWLTAGFALADAVRLQVRLVEADQSRGGSDAALEDVMGHFRNFPYQRYRQVGTRTTNLVVGKKEWLQLGQGHSMLIQVLDVDGDRARLAVTWRKDRREIAKITVISGPNAPFILGGDETDRSAMIAVFSRK